MSLAFILHLVTFRFAASNDSLQISDILVHIHFTYDLWNVHSLAEKGTCECNWEKKQWASRSDIQKMQRKTPASPVLSFNHQESPEDIFLCVISEILQEHPKDWLSFINAVLLTWSTAEWGDFLSFRVVLQNICKGWVCSEGLVVKWSCDTGTLQDAEQGYGAAHSHKWTLAAKSQSCSATMKREKEWGMPSLPSL